MKYWYAVEVNGLVEQFGVRKELLVAVGSNCYWPEDKLTAAVRSAVEPGMTDLQAVLRQRLDGQPCMPSNTYDRVVDLDKALGI